MGIGGLVVEMAMVGGVGVWRLGRGDGGGGWGWDSVMRWGEDVRWEKESVRWMLGSLRERA